MEPSPRILAEYGTLDARSVHWADDGRALFAGSSVEVSDTHPAAHVRHAERN